jgi:hypothetical protein
VRAASSRPEIHIWHGLTGDPMYRLVDIFMPVTGIMRIRL